jgi:hypothetical protein
VRLAEQEQNWVDLVAKMMRVYAKKSGAVERSLAKLRKEIGRMYKHKKRLENSGWRGYFKRTHARTHASATYAYTHAHAHTHTHIYIHTRVASFTVVLQDKLKDQLSSANDDMGAISRHQTQTYAHSHTHTITHTRRLIHSGVARQTERSVVVGKR